MVDGDETGDHRTEGQAARVKTSLEGEASRDEAQCWLIDDSPAAFTSRNTATSGTAVSTASLNHEKHGTKKPHR